MDELISPLTTTLVINRAYGGYGLSNEAAKRIFERKNIPWQKFDRWIVSADHKSAEQFPRNDPDVIAVVREMGEAANGECAKLQVVEVTAYIGIDSNDGFESIGTAWTDTRRA